MLGNNLLKIMTLLFLMIARNACAESINWKETTVPMPEAGKKGLETLLVWPSSPGKHPLALISHGSPRDALQRPGMSAISYLPIAMEFARRGFAVAVILRRGYGNSGGSWAEGYNSCQATNYKHAATESVKDLHAAIQYLSTLPQYDTSRMIAVGISAGGFASIALAADSPPTGLVAVINFAGVRGSMANDSICQLNSLVSIFGEFGKNSHTPMLWVYAENDHFANPVTAQRLLNAFRENGGEATFIKAPSFGNEGHFLFSNAGIPQWTPLVDAFLKTQNLTLVKNLLPLPTINKLDPPTQLSQKNKNNFTLYLSAPPHKAFAIDAHGAYGWSSGKHSTNEAEKTAISACGNFSKIQCHLYAIDDNYANGLL